MVVAGVGVSVGSRLRQLDKVEKTGSVSICTFCTSKLSTGVTVVIVGSDRTQTLSPCRLISGVVLFVLHMTGQTPLRRREY